VTFEENKAAEPPYEQEDLQNTVLFFPQGFNEAVGSVEESFEDLNTMISYREERQRGTAGATRSR
jgi:hypothetical protein